MKATQKNSLPVFAAFSELMSDVYKRRKRARRR